MIICIPFIADREESSGKTLFCQRLGSALSEIDDTKIISDTNKKHDISLHVVHIEEMKHSAKRVTRLDGIYHNRSMDWKHQNKNISKHFYKADAVVYQTQFCKKLVKRYIGKHTGPNAVIFNGADPEFYRDIEPAKVNHAHNFITYSKWRPHKRLLDTMECFLLASIDDSCLYVAGSLERSGLTEGQKKYYFSLPNIKYLGVLNQESIGSYLKSCKASIHLSWIDWCPNSVVEAIVCGTPVITNNVGGTQELVCPNSGIVCEIDDLWDFQPCKLYKPPSFNRLIVAESLIRFSKEKMIVASSHLDIRNIAKKYRQFFEIVLGVV